jgi:hypothetical protein
MPPQPETYVVPARFVLTVLHRRDPDASAGKHPATGEPVEGWTVCGSPMTTGEIWRPIDYRDGDRLCGVCFYEPGSPRAAAEDVEATLW